MPEIAEPEKKSIKDFKPMKNDALADIELSDAQIEQKKIAALPEEPVESPQLKPVDKSEDDSIVPNRADSFDPSDPLSLDVDPPIKQPDPKTDELLQRKEGNSEMRGQIEEANKRTKESDKVSEGLRLANANLMKELEDAKSGLNAAEKKLTHKDPSTHPDVQRLIKPWDDDLNALAKEMSISGSDGAKLKADASALVQQFQQLGEVGSEGYEDRKEALVGEIDISFPDDKREVIRMLNKGANVMDEATSLMESIATDGGEYEKGQALEVYEAMSKDYSELEKGYFNPTEEMRTSSPYSATVIHSDYISKSDKLSSHAEQTKNFVRGAFLPLLPLSRNETRGMTDAEVAAYNQERTAQHRKDQGKIRDIAAPALFSHALLPIVQKQLDEALLQLKTVRDANPKPKGGDITPEASDDEKTNIKEFNPPRSNLKFS